MKTVHHTPRHAGNRCVLGLVDTHHNVELTQKRCGIPESAPSSHRLVLAPAYGKSECSTSALRQFPVQFLPQAKKIIEGPLGDRAGCHVPEATTFCIRGIDHGLDNIDGRLQGIGVHGHRNPWRIRGRMAPHGLHAFPHQR